MSNTPGSDVQIPAESLVVARRWSRKGPVLLGTVVVVVLIAVIAVVMPPSVNSKATSIEFVPIPAGSFWMGCSEGDSECGVAEEPRREVRISKPFELGKYEVTQQQWRAVMGRNPSFFSGARRPVEHVSWHEVQEFLSKLNARQDGYYYRLPTEAEWEYAARAGTSGKYYGDLDAIAWHADNTEPGTHDVGKKQPNAWGLFDTLGNVSEWCQDWYALDYYQQGVDADPQGPSSGTMRVLRGGSWYEKYWFVSVSYRDSMEPEERHSRVGFRCLRERR